MNIAQTTLRRMRIIHGVFLLAAILYIWVPFVAVHNNGRTVTREFVATFSLALGVMVLCIIGLAAYFRSRYVHPSSEKLRDNPDDAEAAGNWRKGIVLSLVFCESIVLYGLVMRILGVGWNISGIFYAVGILLMLVWTPRLELPPP